MNMEKPFTAVLEEFLEQNGKKILDQPERCKALLLDFSQNAYRAETQIFYQLLLSPQSKEVQNLEEADAADLRAIAARFQRTYLFEKEICSTLVFAYAYFKGIIPLETFRQNAPEGAVLAPGAVKAKPPKKPAMVQHDTVEPSPPAAVTPVNVMPGIRAYQQAQTVLKPTAGTPAGSEQPSGQSAPSSSPGQNSSIPSPQKKSSALSFGVLAVIAIAGIAGITAVQNVDKAPNQNNSPAPVFTAVLSGHSDGVSSVAYSPDGWYIASGSLDNTIRIWNAESGRELRTLSGHSDTVRSVAYSPDGRYLASGSDDRTIRIWDAESGQELRRLSGHSGLVLSVAYSPDRRYIASGSDDNTIMIWDAESDRGPRRLLGHSSRVYSLVYSPDGRYIASGSEDKTVRIWDAESGSELRTFPGHYGGVWSVAYSPDGRYIASGSVDRTIRIWNVSGSK
jgi:hypothetical protein